jgi:hypothetical protein
MRPAVPAVAATTVAAVIAFATPAAALERLAKPAGSELVTRVADLDRTAAGPHRRSARTYRHRRAWRHWQPRGVVITSGHPLHYFPGDIVYTYFPGDCCCCRGR